MQIGVLAIQGAVQEHIDCLKQLGASAKLIKVPKDFEGLDGIILPGGESTTMAIVGERCGVFPCLRNWINEKRPVFMHFIVLTLIIFYFI
jgi:5'-phosphate synthase pdxT subunit